VEKLKNCPICENNKLNHYLTCQDYTVSQEKFDLEQCDTCGFVFTNARPEEENIGRYYQSENYISHSNTNKGIVSKIYQAVRIYTLQSKVKLIEDYQPQKGLILDIGCGTGMFLEVCQKNGWKISGIEPDNGARTLAEQQTNIKIEDTILGSFGGQTFDVITMWHVLEHIHKLNETVAYLNQKLNTTGTLIIAVPNYKSVDANQYKEHWAAYDVPRHLYHFSKESITALMQKYGFELLDTKPMLFDSTYVSMLSTKYKYGKTSYIEAFGNGLLSNIKASLGSKDYSSLIYVFKKRI
jgi:2-polyprenyl-3-methyl-5-hydroxy-6-metoxy-1,4-benzoquinol methylase